MATEVLMPKLGLTMTEGTIEEWKYKEGDAVKKGDILFSVATDKLTNDVECEEDGTLLKILLPEGETVKASGMFLCFSTEDIASAHERAVLHGMNPSDIRQPEPDARYFYVYDPDGLSVQVREYR